MRLSLCYTSFLDANEHSVIVTPGTVELVYPFMDGRHAVEHLTREESVLCRRDERLHLGGRSAEQHTEI